MGKKEDDLKKKINERLPKKNENGGQAHFCLKNQNEDLKKMEDNLKKMKNDLKIKLSISCAEFCP